MKKELTKQQEEIVNKVLDYMIDVAKRQGRLLDPDILFGDGTRWKPLTKTGFLVVYQSLLETMKEKLINQ